MLTLLCIITAAQQEQQKFQELENSEPRKVYFWWDGSLRLVGPNPRAL
jgi:hypothetical protein